MMGLNPIGDTTLAVRVRLAPDSPLCQRDETVTSLAQTKGRSGSSPLAGTTLWADSLMVKRGAYAS